MQIMMKHAVAAKAFMPESPAALVALPWWSRQNGARSEPSERGVAQNDTHHDSHLASPDDGRQPPCCEACGRALPNMPAQQGIEVLSVRAGWRRRLLLRWDDIQALSCDAKYINIMDNEGMVHVIEDSLDRLCSIEGAPFVRIHRSHAIHPKALASVVTRSDGSCDFVLSSGIKYPGSRRQSKSARVSIFGETPRRRRGDA